MRALSELGGLVLIACASLPIGFLRAPEEPSSLPAKLGRSWCVTLHYGRHYRVTGAGVTSSRGRIRLEADLGSSTSRRHFRLVETPFAAALARTDASRSPARQALYQGRQTLQVARCGLSPRC